MLLSTTESCNDFYSCSCRRSCRIESSAESRSGRSLLNTKVPLTTNDVRVDIVTVSVSR